MSKLEVFPVLDHNDVNRDGIFVLVDRENNFITITDNIHATLQAFSLSTWVQDPSNDWDGYWRPLDYLGLKESKDIADEFVALRAVESTSKILLIKTIRNATRRPEVSHVVKVPHSQVEKFQQYCQDNGFSVGIQEV